MSEDKMTSDEVPGKFAEWLLSMGCPAEKVPSVDKVAEMCRGQYYMVWRSLMEHVEPKDAIRSKRMQVFCDDMRRCQKKDYNEQDKNAVIPEQLSLWRQQAELVQRVADTKERVDLARQDISQLTEKISTKMSQRNLSRRRTAEVQRRAWLLQHVAEDLRAKRHDLKETRAIADSLCRLDDDTDIQDKLDKCVASLRRQGSQTTNAASLSGNPIASSSVVSTNGDATEFEEQLAALVRCRGDALCAQLQRRRAALVRDLAAAPPPHPPADRVTPQSVLAHTASLHCALALDATKNRVHLKHAHKRLAAAVAELNHYLTGEACELLVVRCERAHVAARVASLRRSLDELTSRAGVFEAAALGQHRAAPGPVAAVDRALESKRDELKKVIMSLAATERKILSARECLAAVFAGFNHDSASDRHRVPQVELPQESISSLRQFYSTRRERRRRRVDVSFELEVSDCSYEAIDNTNPRFVDELRIYLKLFSLEKNRKLVLESGEKIWIFETTESLLERLHTRWQSERAAAALCDVTDVTCVAQRSRARHALARILADIQGGGPTRDIEIKSQTDTEEQTIDKIKKRLKESLLILQKTEKTLALGHGNLALWADNQMKNHISTNRTVNGMIYRDYEISYLDNCLNV